MKQTFFRSCLIMLLGILLAGCSALEGADVKSDYPLDPEDTRRVKRGKLTGEGGLKLFGGSDDPAQNGSTGVGVNSFLWRASLDTLSFMPLSSVDPHGGVIITDWYEDPEARGERFKINVLILGMDLRSDGLRVSVFKQEKDEAGGWLDSRVEEDVSRQLEDKILTRARELRIANAS